jgi:hypothetical protein
MEWARILAYVTGTRPCLFWVKRVGFPMSDVCPIYTQHRTFPDPIGTSRLGQLPKSALE